MMGKFIFKTKKLLSLLAFGVLFFIAIEIWISHKKMEALNPNGRESLEKANEEDLNFNNKHHLEKPHTTGEIVYTTDNEVKMKLNKILISDKARSNNNIYNSYEETFAEFDDNFRNRTDFKGGGEESDGGPGNYGEGKYGSPDGKENYEIHEHNNIPCNINGDYMVHCLRDGDEVYVPFSFIKKYFEISGELALNRKGMEELTWKHSYAKVYEVSQMEGKAGRKRWLSEYQHDGVFMSFEHYRVEIRDRVKYISAKEGVPISKQWGAQGYFYPIQIAQFGLSHYSKMMIESERKFHLLGTSKSQWLLSSNAAQSGEFEVNEKSSLNVIKHNTRNISEVEVLFNISNDLGPKLFYYLDIPDIPSGSFSSNGNSDFLSFEIKYTNNASLTIVFKTKLDEEYRIHYIASEATVVVEEGDIYYGMGLGSGWHKLTRDVKIDFQKSLPKKIRKKLSSKLFPLRLLRLELRGSGCVKNIQLSDQDHLSLFYHSANWMVKNQDSKGGWPIPVSRVLVKGIMSLEPGWYSAMAQGHAMSLLSRAYSQSRNPLYLRAAYRAINPFLVPSSEGGVLTYLFGQHPWYEEYPTVPPSFVINGFMYALFGLYDLAKTLESFGINQASFMLEDGLPLEPGTWLTELENSSDNKLASIFVNKGTNVLTGQLITAVNTTEMLSLFNNSLNTDLHNAAKPFHDSHSTSSSYETQKRGNMAEAENLTRNSANQKFKAAPNKFKMNHHLNPAENVNAYHAKDELDEIPEGQLFSNQPTDEREKMKLRSRSKRSLLLSSDDILSPQLLSKAKDTKTAKQLFNAGLKTLKLALPLFDSGSGSFYDLRHFSVPGCAPNRARWDYHSTHISQLLMVLSMDEDPAGKDLFQKTITRWMSYMKGKRAPHN